MNRKLVRTTPTESSLPLSLKSGISLLVRGSLGPYGRPVQPLVASCIVVPDRCGVEMALPATYNPR